MMPANTWIQRKMRLSHSLMVGSMIIVVTQAVSLRKHRKLTVCVQMLASAISRVAIRADQKWDMVVLGCVIDLEYDCHLREKAFDFYTGKIGLSIKHQAVGAAGNWFSYQKERLDASVIVSPGMTELGPAFVCVLRFQIGLHTTRRSAAL